MRTTRFVLTAGRVSRQLFGRPVGGAGGRLAQRTAHDGAEPTASSAAAASPLPPWRARATRTPADLGRASHGADGVGAAGRARGGGGYEHDEHGSTRVLRVYSRDEVRALLDRALHRSSRQTVYWFGGTTLFLLLAWLLYREQAKAKMTQELADLASRSLGNKSVQSKTAEMSMATLAALLADDQTRVRTLDWLQHMLEDPRMIAAVVHLVQQVLQDENTIEKASELVQLVFAIPAVREAVLAGLQDVICSDRFLETAAAFGYKLISTDQVGEAATALLQEAAASLLQDAAVREAARSFVLSLLETDTLQRKTGAHLRSAVVSMFNPVAWIRTEPTAASAGTLAEADKSATALAETAVAVSTTAVAAAAEHLVSPAGGGSGAVGKRGGDAAEGLVAAAATLPDERARRAASMGGAAPLASLGLPPADSATALVLANAASEGGAGATSTEARAALRARLSQRSAHPASALTGAREEAAALARRHSEELSAALGAAVAVEAEAPPSHDAEERAEPRHARAADSAAHDAGETAGANSAVSAPHGPAEEAAMAEAVDDERAAQPRTTAPSEPDSALDSAALELQEASVPSPLAGEASAAALFAPPLEIETVPPQQPLQAQQPGAEAADIDIASRALAAEGAPTGAQGAPPYQRGWLSRTALWLVGYPTATEPEPAPVRAAAGAGGDAASAAGGIAMRKTEPAIRERQSDDITART